MPVTRRAIACLLFLIWCWALIWFGSSNKVAVAAISLFFGFFLTFDIRRTGVVSRAVVDVRSKEMEWMSVRVIMPRDGHVTREKDDFVGSVQEVRDLASKQGTVAKSEG